MLDSAIVMRIRFRENRRDLIQPPHRSQAARLEHDPEKWEPVFGQDHAQAKN